MVTQPHNAFLLEAEQNYWEGNKAGYTGAYYGTPTHASLGAEDNLVIYPEIYSDVRKGLICAFPNDELVFNTALTLDDQNPSEIFWE